MKSLASLFILLFVSAALAQDFEIGGEVTLFGAISSEDNIPFWMHANTNTTRGYLSNFSGTGEANGRYGLSDNAFIEGGVAYFYRDDVADEFQRKNSYLRFQNNWLKVTLGAKAQDIVNKGLSATNKNFLWSANARPLPGLVIEANDPIKISNMFEIDWGIGHYSLNDDRYVDDVRVHYKRLALITKFNENNKLTTQIQHFVQWAGTSPEFGKLQGDFSAFVDVFFARKSEEIFVEGEILNAVGNHLGSFLIDYELTLPGRDRFSIYHEHPFEDGSGTRWANFPDGVWGIFYEPENTSVFKAIQYEYITTVDQSNSPTGGVDNYFSNSVYRSGWTYEGNIVGLPFITFDPSVEISETNSPIINNQVETHHFGFSGKFKSIDWMFKSTIVRNLGIPGVPFSPEIKNWYNYASFGYDTKKYGAFTLSGGADFNNVGNDVFGGAIQYQYSF